MATEPRRGLEPAATACPKGAAAAGESKARAEDSETHSTQAPDSNRFANNSKANHSCLCATLDPPNSSFGSPMFWEELFTADGTDALEQPTDSNRKQIDIAEHTTGKTYTCTTSSALSSSSSSLSSSCSFSLSSSSFSCSVDCISIVRRCPSCISCLSLRRLFRFDLPVLWPPSVSSIWERHLRELLNALAFRPTAGKENLVDALLGELDGFLRLSSAVADISLDARLSLSRYFTTINSPTTTVHSLAPIDSLNTFHFQSPSSFSLCPKSKLFSSFADPIFGTLGRNLFPVLLRLCLLNPSLAQTAAAQTNAPPFDILGLRWQVHNRSH
eukprot:GHVT01053353.1.p2 GENE.GHVT01053353.1~~GHVT01053353.1.p2  ORF type:complete len:329 (+),score=55.55 GHVT01053353.1:2771-3757(+)